MTKKWTSQIAKYESQEIIYVVKSYPFLLSNTPEPGHFTSKIANGRLEAKGFVTDLKNLNSII